MVTTQFPLLFPSIPESGHRKPVVVAAPPGAAKSLAKRIALAVIALALFGVLGYLLAMMLMQLSPMLPYWMRI
ncbi:MAG: hypothetical protein ABR964_13585 [Tepidisphaeraceae bacterium]|jgi:hypothetical protein